MQASRKASQCIRELCKEVPTEKNIAYLEQILDCIMLCQVSSAPLRTLEEMMHRAPWTLIFRGWSLMLIVKGGFAYDAQPWCDLRVQCVCKLMSGWINFSGRHWTRP